MDAIQILALIFAIAVLIKLVIVAISAKSWMKFVKGLYSKPSLLMVVELILAAIVFYYLLQTLTVIQIIGGVLLGALLTGMTFAAYAKEMIPAFDKILKGSGLKKAWLPILIWLALVILVLKELFM